VAAFCLQAGAEPARAAQPKAVLEGAMKSALRSKIVDAIGELDRPVTSRFEARRRAREAADNAEAVLRSEGYYAGEVEPTVTEFEPSMPVVSVALGRGFVFPSPRSFGSNCRRARGAKGGRSRHGVGGRAGRRAADVVDALRAACSAVQKRGYADVLRRPGK